jgi:MarC family membrane protein
LNEIAVPDWGELTKLTIALLAIVDPFGTVPLFLGALDGAPVEARVRAARAAAVTVFIVLAVSALAGDAVLGLFGISIAAFMVGGGLLLLLLSVSMLQAKESRLRQTPEEAAEATASHAIGVVPVGMPLLAGPGAISTVIIYAHGTQVAPSPVALLGPIFVVSLVVWGTLHAAGAIARRMSTTGLHIMTRVMGLILASLAVEIMARGLLLLFPGLR